VILMSCKGKHHTRLTIFPYKIHVLGTNNKAEKLPALPRVREATALAANGPLPSPVPAPRRCRRTRRAKPGRRRGPYPRVRPPFLAPVLIWWRRSVVVLFSKLGASALARGVASSGRLALQPRRQPRVRLAPSARGACGSRVVLQRRGSTSYCCCYLAPWWC
jgi:hypothetical protein